jgi:hypothetical protein
MNAPRQPSEEAADQRAREIVPGHLADPSVDNPFSEESLRKWEEWRRMNSPKSQPSKAGRIWGYVYRGMGLAFLYGIASVWGYEGVPEAAVIVAVIAYYWGQATAKVTRY